MCPEDVLDDRDSPARAGGHAELPGRDLRDRGAPCLRRRLEPAQESTESGRHYDRAGAPRERGSGIAASPFAGSVADRTAGRTSQTVSAIPSPKRAADITSQT